MTAIKTHSGSPTERLKALGLDLPYGLEVCEPPND
jgi:hypothetical protein